LLGLGFAQPFQIAHDISPFEDAASWGEMLAWHERHIDDAAL
jgi:hypothetical protein